MEKEYFKIQMPRGLSRNSLGEWVAFNYYGKPLGVNELGERVYEESPEPGKYRHLPHKVVFELPQPMENFEYDRDGKVCRIFLYDEHSMPFNVPKKWFGVWMKIYNNKLTLLAFSKYISD